MPYICFMKELLLIFIGGGLGSISRYGVSKVIYSTSHSFPLATFAVNMAGSLIIGVFAGLIAKNSSIPNQYLLFATTGFCGGFTTFSAFTLENVSLFRQGDYFNFLLYSLGSLIIGFIGVVIGLATTKAI